MRTTRAILSALLLVLALPASASAFCGFYVAGSDANLVSDATQVVMMRYATTTIQSMQNNYEGPPEDFAMVVPVPQVLKRENVKTLPKDAFDKIDVLTSPRLVEYWEQDPCGNRYDWDGQPVSGSVDDIVLESAPSSKRREKKVKVEAKFSVGEYDIVILSATESTALDTWLKQNGYKIPDGAEPFLAPYVEAGMYFFVARVDIERVTSDAGGKAVLSPLRFHYENDSFFLPIRLGMINSAGNQDLVVYVLGEQFRFEVANRENVFIPTNIEVKDQVRDNFGAFYNSLFDATQAAKPGAVVTEYAWGSSKCDPCPGPTLTQEDILTFGGDVISDEIGAWNWVVTRLHARYGADGVGEDLVFAKAAAISGGREVRLENGALEQGAAPATFNNFQARYIIRHEWEGAADCEDPTFGVWGGPPGQGYGTGGVSSAPSANTRGEAVKTEVAVDYAALVKSDVPTSRVIPAREVELPKPSKGSRSCAGCATGGEGAMWPLVVLGVIALGRRRSRRD